MTLVRIHVQIALLAAKVVIMQVIVAVAFLASIFKIINAFLPAPLDNIMTMWALPVFHVWEIAKSVPVHQHAVNAI